VVDFVQAGNSKSTAVRVFKVARQTIYSWLQLSKEGTLMEVNNYVSRRSKLNHEEVKEFVDSHSDWYYREIGDHFKVSPETIRRLLKKLNYTVKKNRRYTEKQMKH
jgi:transposase